MRDGGGLGRNRARSLGGAVVVTLVLALLTPAAVVAGEGAGSLDPTFGTGGVREDDFGSTEAARGVAVQPDGRIVVAGTGCGGDVLVARYTSTGLPDPSFSGDGWTCVDVGTGSADQGEEIFVLAAGKLLVAGTSAGDFALVRLNPDGSPDPTFDGDGRATYDFGAAEQLNDAALAPGGKVVLAGTSERPGCLPLGPSTAVDTALARVDVASGGLDPGFGNGGRVLLQNGEVLRTRALAVQPDGAVVFGGNTASCTRVTVLHFVRRLTGGGQPDPTFSPPPPLFDLGPTTVRDIVLQADGKLVAVIDSFAGPGRLPARNDAFYVQRLNPDGTPDTTFDGDGLAVVLFGEGLDATATAAVVQPDGKIVVGGALGPASGGPRDFALARLDADGSPDAAFGNGGTVVTDLGGDDVVLALALQPDARLVAAGASEGNVALARYLLAAGAPSPAGTCLGHAATIAGTPGNDALVGTPGADVIVGLGGRDAIDGRGGDDRICGGDGDDAITSGEGNDRVAGEGGNDRITGAAGDDVLLGNDGSDALSGGRGNDVLDGGPEDSPPPDTDACNGGGETDVFANCERVA